MDKLLTVCQAAEYLQLHTQTLYKTREIPRARIGGSVRFKKSDLEKYVEQGTVKPPSIPSELQRLARYAKLNQKGGNCAVSKKKQRWNYGFGFGGIYIRRTSKGEEKYYIWFYDEHRKRQRKVVREAISKEQAELALYSEIQKVFDRKYGNGKTEKRITFVDFSKEYLETYARIKKKSFESDERYLANHLVPYFGKMDISEITPPHIQSFIKKKLDVGIQKNSVNRYLQVMRSMLNIAKENGYKIGDNPVRQKDLFDESEFRRLRVLSRREEKGLLKEAPAHLKPIIRYALLSGCRLQEILGLQRGDIDLSKDVIAIQPEINKSGKLDVIPIHSELKKFLVEHLSMNGKNDNVFTYTDRATREVKPIRSIYRGFHGACKRAGIKDFQFRDLRTTAATRWHEQGVDPLVISRAVLRHSSFKISEQFYIRSSVEHMKDALNKTKLTHN
jgi:excisionase family DNA binding protein